MRTFYINLDNACERRKKFEGGSVERWRATSRQEVPPFIEEKMLSMTNFAKDKHLARCGCFMSHTRLWEHIVEQKLDDVLILEDDALQMRSLPHDYPRDSIVYVGGFIHNRKMMDNTKPNIEHKLGINEVSFASLEEYRVLGCLAYIIPTWRVALTLLNKIYAQKRYRAIDIMLGNIGIKQYYNYPASFREEGSPSQISSREKIMTDKYEFISKKRYESQNN
jgi:GR25 family glycosyltransferase involved in LPS biosynthesis